MAIPAILLAIAMVSLFRSSVLTVIIAITVPQIPGVVRLVRSIVLSVREEPYVEAAVTLGTSTPKLLWRHVLPNTIAPMIVQGTFICAVRHSHRGHPVVPRHRRAAGSADLGQHHGRGQTGVQPVPAQHHLSRRVPRDDDPRRQRAGRRIARHARSQDGEAGLTWQHPSSKIANLSVAIKGSGDRPHAVRGINITVGANEIVCVVGESGSGKSVTAQAVMGLLPKNAMQVETGSIRLQGEELTTKSDAELRAIRGTRMAMVFQEPMTALNPVERVGDQIGEVLEIHTDLDPKERRKRVLEIMRAVHLPDPEQMIDAYPHQLSGGQRQRIMIAAALVLDPALLIADEPTTALDVTTQAQILKLVREMQGRKKTGVLFITHDFGVVSEIADRVVVMQLGRDRGAGPVRGGAAQPARGLHQDAAGRGAEHDAAEALAGERSRWCCRPRNCSRPTAGARCSSRRRGSSHAVSDVSLTVRRGETLGIVGEIRLRQVDGGALRRAAGASRPAARSGSTTSTSRRCRKRNSARCGGGCSSCFRIPTGRSIRAARSAKPSSRGR